MATRRMISRSISTSKKVARLSDFAALLYTWIIPHTDDFGRMDGDATTVKAKVVPLRRSSVSRVDGALKEIEKMELIRTYKSGDETYLEVTNFNSFQTFRPDRTRQAEYPIPTEKEIENEVAVDLSSYERGMQLVKTQYHLSLSKIIPNSTRFFRIDILAVDNKGIPVLIEVKKDKVRAFSCDFLENYSEVFEQIEGKKPRLVIVAPDFEEETKSEAKKRGITLWKFNEGRTTDIPTTPTGKKSSSQDKRREYKVTGIGEILKRNTGDNSRHI